MNVPQCPTCGKQLEQGVRFCPEDGTPLTDTASALSDARTQTHMGLRSIQLQLPLVLGNRYKLLEARGGGGMAKVYRAIDITLEREVAVKLINPELRAEPEFDARFQREARIASQLADPHIVVVHDFGIDGEHGPFLVMEFLQGQSLRERLQQGALPMPVALQMSGQLLLALIHAHSKGIVHRDIKPDNIFLLNQSGVRVHVRVLDFGIARIFRGEADGAPSESLTQPGAVLGTPRYMSPEQLAGQQVDARSDLYSTALVIYESLTGQLPYTSGKKLCELCPEASPQLQQLIEKCLKPNAAERPASAEEAYLRLQELGKLSGVQFTPHGVLDRVTALQQAQVPTILYVPGTNPLPWWRRRRVVTMLLVSALLALFVGWGLFRFYHPAPNSGEAESLLDFKIGQDANDYANKLGGLKHSVFYRDPWTNAAGRVPAFLGNALQPSDLDMNPIERQNLSYVLSDDENVCLILRPDPEREEVKRSIVAAMVVRTPHKAATGRGVRIGDNVATLFRYYPESPSDVEEKELTGTPDKAGRKPHVEVRRHDDRGIAFEVQDGKITAITLYPAKP